VTFFGERGGRGRARSRKKKKKAALAVCGKRKQKIGLGIASEGGELRSISPDGGKKGRKCSRVKRETTWPIRRGKFYQGGTVFRRSGTGRRPFRGNQTRTQDRCCEKELEPVSRKKKGKKARWKEGGGKERGP